MAKLFGSFFEGVAASRRTLVIGFSFNTNGQELNTNFS
jgi:hypothetical protein